MAASINPAKQKHLVPTSGTPARSTRMEQGLFHTYGHGLCSARHKTPVAQNRLDEVRVEEASLEQACIEEACFVGRGAVCFLDSSQVSPHRLRVAK